MDCPVTTSNCSVNIDTNFILLHAGSDHGGVRITFRLPRYVFREEKMGERGKMETKLNTDTAKVKLKEVGAGLNVLDPKEVGERLHGILFSCTERRQRRKKYKRERREWYDASLKGMKTVCTQAWKVLELALSKN